ncbi:glycosyltransferase family 39 protein [Actinoplanes xinjiangensis]|uniref:glycosyltransferase family 39 protein n=1 Tax=Actinoplanes xinjiangensis TaxID=512350 RepID=UPI003432447F
MLPPLVTAIIGGWRATAASLWADELATWGAVRLDWEQLWRLGGSVDAVVTPYYAALKVFAGVAGTGTLALRLPSLIAAVLTAVVVAELGRRAAGDTVGLLAGLLWAVLPVTSRYAQEARPYAIAVLCAALALLALIRLVERPGPGRAVVYAAAVAATGLLHPLSALLMVAGHALAGMRTWRFWLPAAVVGGLPAAVLLLYATRQTAQISWISPVGVQTLRLLPAQLFVSAIAGGMVLALAVLGLRRDRIGLTLAAAGFVPPALLLAVGTVAEIWVPRYVLVAMPALVVLAARGAGTRTTAIIGLVALLGWPTQVDIREPAGHGQDSARIAQIVQPRYRAGDVAVFPDGPSSIGWAPRDMWARYLRDPRPADVLAVAGQRVDGRFLARECPQATCLGSPPRIWIIRVDSPADPLADMSDAKRARIGGSYRVVQRWSHPLLGITLMERTAR